MKVKVKKEVPPGGYQAAFCGAELTEHEQYGPGLQWSWQIRSGEFDGMQVYRTTKTVATGRNSAGKLLVGITGKPLDSAMNEDLDKFKGKIFHVVVGLSENGSARVEAVAASNGTPQDEGPDFHDRF